jgi:hypothetical protein
MAAVKIPAFPKGVARGVWANKLAGSAIYAIESDAINYDTGTAVNIFSIPEGLVLMDIGVEIATAFNGASVSLTVQDTAEDLANFDVAQAGFFKREAFKRYAVVGDAPGNKSRSIQIDVNGNTGTAGVARVWLFLKPDRSAFRKDNIAAS